jgi:hypothetical protein
MRKPQKLQPHVLSSIFLTPDSPPSEILTPYQVRCIDNLLQSMNGSGEVRLVKAKGKLRFIQVVTNEDMLP